MQLLLKQCTAYAWTQGCADAFTGVKHALCTAPVLVLPDLREGASPFEVICDASGTGMGSVLMQAGRPIAFHGKRLSPAEQNYHVGEQQLLAVIHSGGAIWISWLSMITAPTFFFADKIVLSPRQTKWAERLSHFQFTWEHRPGRVNLADLLSRHPAFEATTALNSITLDLLCLTLSSADGAELSAVVTRGHAAPPPPPDQHARTDMSDSNAPAAAQHTCTDMSDSSAPAAMPAVSDHAAPNIAAENAEAATADAEPAHAGLLCLTPGLLLHATQAALDIYQAYTTGGALWSHTRHS